MLFRSKEERRRQQAEAAERRRQENESRGVKNLDKVRRQQQRAADMERREEEAARQGGNSPTLRVSQEIPIYDNLYSLKIKYIYFFKYLKYFVFFYSGRQHNIGSGISQLNRSCLCGCLAPVL